MKQTKEQKRAYDKKRYPKIKEQQKEYKLKNREHIKEQQKEYKLKNKGQISERNKIWRLKNPEYKKEYDLKNKEHSQIRQRNRYRTDINYKLRTNCGNRIRMALKGNFKSASTMKLIGCTIDELRAHIESQFEPWMTWENHGLWDVDHIKAMSKFDFRCPVQQLACCHWSNLQPLEHIANIKKGAR